MAGRDRIEILLQERGLVGAVDIDHQGCPFPLGEQRKTGQLALRLAQGRGEERRNGSAQ